LQGQNSNKAFTDEYIESCFTHWYSLNQPSNLVILQENIPESPEGKKPSLALLRNYKDEYGWIERADALNAKAIEKVEHHLIDMKSDMLKRQAKTAFAIAKKAEDYLMENGFDTAASAVNAIKWAQEEERTVRGVSEMMIKISRMTPDELMAEAAKLLKRNSEVIDIIPEELEKGEEDV
jgi:hypothetical protein